jgi:signal transduction histidine kinase/DNA-binding response OmpR family regulator
LRPLPRRALVALVLGLSVASIALLAFVSIRIATNAVLDRVHDNLRSSSSISALYVSEQLRGLAEVDASFASRPSLGRALRPGHYDPGFVRFTLRQLIGVRRGIGTAFVADDDGKLIDILPPTPAIVGDDFSYRDWYKGVSRTGRPYVSRAYVSKAKGNPTVVAVAAPVFGEAGGQRRRLAIIVAAYTLDTLRGYVQAFARAQDLTLRVTDQSGAVVAGGRSAARGLDSARGDPLVAAALAGRQGTKTVGRGDKRRLAAYAPVPGAGWTVTAEIPASRALASVHRLRWTVAIISGLLVLLLGVGALAFDRALRRRQLAEEETAAAFAEAERQERLKQAVLDGTKDAIVMVDTEGRAVLANAPTGEIISLHGLADRGGTLFEDAEQIRDRTTDPEAYWKEIEALAADPAYEGAFEYELADSGHAFETYVAPICDDDGALIGRIVVIRDITGEHSAERLKSELMATVSHELRTPLAGILGFTELLSSRELDETTRTSYLSTIHKEARRLTELINDFLDLQRIEEGQLTLALEPLALQAILAQQAKVFAGQSSEHRIELDVPEEPLTVLAEPDRIAQVTANLISNAIKYAPGGGFVRVTAVQLNGWVRVSVVDDGLGIPADQQRSIFTKFFRVDSSDTRRIGGTGLGLALCREIVEAHGGRIGFQSKEGDGSTFWFELPAAVTRNGHAEHKRVLVVEDDPAAAAFLAETLNAAGLSVEVLARGEDAVVRAAQDVPAAICLDVTLGDDVDGWEVLSRLKSDPRTEAVPVIVCTGGNGRDRAGALGAADFLTKPFSAAQLRSTVLRLLPEGGASVLVVDDDAGVRSLVRATLRGDGLRLREAGDGAEALAAIDAERPDAIVLDLAMPELDGFAVLDRLRMHPETSSIPVVVLTARQLTAAERRSLQQGAVALLEKSSYSAHELRSLVERAVAA